MDYGTGKDLADWNELDLDEKSYYCLVGGNLGNTTLKFNMKLTDFIENARIYNAKVITADEESAEGAGGDRYLDLDAQRPLHEGHAKGLALFTLMGLVDTSIKIREKRGIDVPKSVLNMQEQLGVSEYSALQPFVVNIRNCGFGGAGIKVAEVQEAVRVAGEDRWVPRPVEGGVRKVTLAADQVFSVVDGQHRLRGFQMVKDWLESVLDGQGVAYPPKTKGKLWFEPKHIEKAGHRRIPQEILDFWQDVLNVAMKNTYVAVECHLGASPYQERQIFSDLNSKGKKVELSLSLDYDTSDPVNKFIKDELLGLDGLISFKVNSKDQGDWHKDNGGQLRKDLNSITSLCMFGKVSSRGTTPAEVKLKKGLAREFWKHVQLIESFGVPEARAKTVAAQPVVLKGLARLVFELSGAGNPLKLDEVALKKLWTHLKSGKLSFSHNNKVWRSLMLSSEARNKDLPGISDYVHVARGTNLDAGTFDSDNGWVRFGSKHNDIYPRINDLIRYQLQIPPRTSVTNAIAREQKAMADDS